MWPWLAVTGADAEVILLSWVWRGFVRHPGHCFPSSQGIKTTVDCAFCFANFCVSGIELLWLLRGHVKTFVYLIVGFELHT